MQKHAHGARYMWVPSPLPDLAKVCVCTLRLQPQWSRDSSVLSVEPEWELAFPHSVSSGRRPTSALLGKCSPTHQCVSCWVPSITTPRASSFPSLSPHTPHYFPKLYVLVFSQDAAQHQCPSLTRCFSRNLLSWENGTGQRSELRIREGWAEWAVTGHSSLSKRKQRKGRPGAARRARGSGSDLTLERFKFECVCCLSFLPLLPAWHNHRRV